MFVRRVIIIQLYCQNLIFAVYKLAVFYLQDTRMSNVKRITVDVVKETVSDLETFDWKIGKEDALYVREVAVDQLEIEFAKEVHEHHVFNLV